MLLLLALTFVSVGQEITTQLTITNPIGSCNDAKTCQINECHDRVNVILSLSNIPTNSTPSDITITLPDHAIVVANSAKVNATTVPSNCSISTNICFTSNNGIAKWTFPSQNLTSSSATLTFTILFDCSQSQPQNGIKLGIAAPSFYIPESADNFIEYSLVIAKPEIEIQNLPNTSLALLYETKQRAFKICSTGDGIIDAFQFLYTPEVEIGNATTSILFSFTGNTGNSLNLPCVAGGTLTHNFTPTVIQQLITNGYLSGNTCINATETYYANSCSPSNSLSTYSASVLCNQTSCSPPNIIVPCSTCPAPSNSTKTSDAKIAESQITDLTTNFFLRDNNESLISSGISPCSAANGGFRFDYQITNPATSSGFAANSNYKSLQTFTAAISLGNTGQQGWFLLTPTPAVFINNTQITNGISITPSGITIDFNQLGSPINPLLDLNLDNAFNELPGNSSITISIRNLKLNLQNISLDNCNANISQYIIGASSSSGTNRSNVTYKTMCTTTAQSTKYFLTANYTNSGNSIIYGSPNPADAQAGITNMLNFCWENTGAPNNNPWDFNNGSNSLITCAPNDLTYQVKLTLPQSILFTSNPNLTFTAIPGNTTAITLPLPVNGPNNSLVYYINNAGRSGCLSGNVTLNHNNTAVCDVPNGLTSGSIDATAEVRAICSENGCVASFCIGNAVNHLYYHCPGGCTGTLTGVHAITNSQPIILNRIDDPSDNTNTGQPDLSRAYPCDEIYVEVHGTKSAGTSNTVFLSLTYDKLAGSNTIFTYVSSSGQYSIDGGNTWQAISSITAPFSNSSNKWELRANISNAQNISTTSPNGLRFRLKLKVNNNLPGGVYNLQEIRADIGYYTGTTYFGSCDTWAGHLLVLAHDYNFQRNFIAADNSDYGNNSLGACHQRLLIRTYVQGGLPQSDEMPNEIRPLVLWPNNAPHNLRINTDLQDMTVTNISFSSNYGNSNIPVSSPQASTSGNDFIIYGTTQSPPGSGNYGWPIIDKSGMTTLDMSLLIDFDKKSCEATKPLTNLYFPYWTRNNGSCNPASAFTPNSTSPYALTTQGATASSIVLTVNNSNNNTVNIAPTSNPYIIPISIRYNGIPYAIDNGWMFNSSQATIEIGNSASGPFTTISPNTYFATGILQNGVSKNYFLRITFQSCSPQNIVLKSGYTCSPINSLPVPPNNTIDCETITKTISINPVEPTLKLTAASGSVLTPQSPNNCGSYTIKLNLKSVNATSYTPDFSINIPAGLVLTSCKFTYSSNSQTFSVATTGSTTVSMSNVLNTLLTNTVGGYYLPVNGVIAIEAKFTGDINNCVTGSVSPNFIASGQNLCNSIITSNSLSATFNFVSNTTSCPACVPCFTYKPTVAYSVSNAGCNNQQGSIFIQVTAAANVSNVVYHYLGINGNTLSGTGTAQSGATINGLTAGSYSVYISYDVNTGSQVKHCSTDPQVVTIIKPNCCSGDVVTGTTTTQTIDGTVTPVLTSNLPPQQVSWLNTPGDVAINGTFIVNTPNFDFVGCHVLLGENARIEISNTNSSSLSIKSCTLETCDDWMWQGIFLEGNNSQLSVRSSTIRDAFWAIRADDAGILNVAFSKFENNHDGIAIANAGPAFFAPLIGNTFSNPAQDLKKPLHGNRSLVGIQVQNVDGWQIGEDNEDPAQTNHFIGLNCGIHSFNSRIEVLNNYFENIKNYRLPTLIGTQPQSVPNYPFRGWAVWALSGWADDKEGKLVVRTTKSMVHFGSPQSKNFIGCDGAVYAANSTTAIYLNNIVECKSGIKIAYAKSRDSHIMFNNLWDCLYGVTYSNNINSYQFVAGNYIRNADQYVGYPFNTITTGSYGVYVTETQPNVNYIVQNEISRSHIGVKLLKTSGATYVQRNKINLWDNVSISSRRIGISVDNAKSGFIAENIVLGNGPVWTGGLLSNNSSWNAERRIGIFANASPNLTITCNHLGRDPDNGQTPGIGRALCFRQNCNTAFDAIRENYMSNTFVPLYLERLGPNNADIGKNVGDFTHVNRNSFGYAANPLGAHTYNNCISGSTVYTTDFWYRGTDPFQNTVNKASTNNPIHEMQNRTASNNADVFIECEDANFNGLVTGGGGNTDWWTDALKALDLTNYPDYEDFLKSLEKRDLYSRLDKNMAYRQSLSAFENFYSDYQATDGKKLYESEQIIEEVKKQESEALLLQRKALQVSFENDGNSILAYSRQIENALNGGDTSGAEMLRDLLYAKVAQLEATVLKAELAEKYNGDTAKAVEELQLEKVRKEYEELSRKLTDESNYADTAAITADKLEAEQKKTAYEEGRTSLDNSFADTLDTKMLQKWMEGEQELLELYSQKNYEQNEREIELLQIKAAKQGPDALSEEEWNWVGNLANACPLEQGYAVYTARALYSYIDHTIDYDDIALCEQVGFYKTDETEQDKGAALGAEKANLWYDTKAEVAFIKYEFLPDVSGSVNIYNVMGQPVANRNLEPNSRLAMLHLSNTVSGDYFYVIRSAYGLSVSGKFIVIK